MASWFKCDCGEVLRKNVFAGANLQFLVPEHLLDRETPHATVRELVSDVVSSLKVLTCTRCGRLYVVDESGKLPTQTYRPDPSSEGEPAPTLNLLVLRCDDLERSGRFYEALGWRCAASSTAMDRPITPLDSATLCSSFTRDLLVRLRRPDSAWGFGWPSVRVGSNRFSRSAEKRSGFPNRRIRLDTSYCEIRMGTSSISNGCLERIVAE